jgi:hypothetical protein
MAWPNLDAIAWKLRSSMVLNPCERRISANTSQRMLVRKLKHILFVFKQNLHGEWVIED